MNTSFVISGMSGPTTRVACYDTVGQINEALQMRNGAVASAVLITCEDYNIRFALGDAIPTRGAGAVGHILFANQSIRLSNSYAIRTFRFTNAVAGNNATLQVTFEFPIGR
jgi:hypothetical protein